MPRYLPISLVLALMWSGSHAVETCRPQQQCHSQLSPLLQGQFKLDRLPAPVLKSTPPSEQLPSAHKDKRPKFHRGIYLNSNVGVAK